MPVATVLVAAMEVMARFNAPLTGASAMNRGLLEDPITTIIVHAVFERPIPGATP